MSTYVTPAGIAYRGAKARAEAARRDSDHFATSVAHVRWEEHYSVRFDGKGYHVARIKHNTTGEWRYEVTCVIGFEQRWCDPDGRVAKRVIAALLPLIEV